jgi:hypothetical protein
MMVHIAVSSSSSSSLLVYILYVRERPNTVVVGDIDVAVRVMAAVIVVGLNFLLKNKIILHGHRSPEFRCLRKIKLKLDKYKFFFINVPTYLITFLLWYTNNTIHGGNQVWLSGDSHVVVVSIPTY